jgi:hypothetical protein
MREEIDRTYNYTYAIKLSNLHTQYNSVADRLLIVIATLKGTANRWLSIAVDNLYRS